LFINSLPACHNEDPCPPRAKWAGEPHSFEVKCYKRVKHFSIGKFFSFQDFAAPLGCLSKIPGKIPFAAKFLLSCLQGEDSASRTERVGDYPLAKGFLKPVWDCGSPGYRII
jgi:hypothetical protein